MTLLGEAGFALAAALFAALAGWQLVRPRGGVIERLLVLGFVATALWALAGAVEGPLALTTRIASSGRNAAWLGFMLVLLFAARTERATRTSLVLVYATLFGVIGGQILFDLLSVGLGLGPRAAAACAFVALLLRMMTSVGALVLVHNLYTAAAREARWAIRLPMAALAVMWTFDLNGYALAYLMGQWPLAIFAARGWVAAGTAPLFAIALWRHAGFRMQLSRAATFQSLSLLAIIFYLGLMLVAARAAQILGGDGGWLGVATLLLAVAVGGAALLVPPRARAWTRVTVLKHLFQHRYDYRAEWLRFTDTLGRGGEVPLEPRVVKALADIVEAPGGLLLLPQADGALAAGARWRWPAPAPQGEAAGAALARHLEATGRIIELDPLRAGREVPAAEAALVPAWLMAEPAAWVAVPLVHFGRLAGVVLLGRPPLERALDWEDFDLLRAAGRQGASYLAEARGQQALGEAKRFEEFNQRFAFIIHDIKNLVSQLSLVARNAERHADNPAFRADMIATLRESVGRMNDLLARLSQHGGGRGEEPRAVALKALADAVAGGRRGQHAVRVEGADDVLALADPARLEQALGHLLQNAIDASAPQAAVRLRVARTAEQATIDVVDAGTGMSAEFVAARLFTPFASTKPGGFGIGAYEARALVQAMGGRLEVESTPGVGSRFRLSLPIAADATAGLVRKRA